MQQTLLRLCLALGLAGICVGSAWFASRLALQRSAAGSLPVDLRSELEVDYGREDSLPRLPPLEHRVSEQAREDEAQLATRFSREDLDFVPVFSTLPDWQAVPTPAWLLTPPATGPAEGPLRDSTATPRLESTPERSSPSGSAMEKVVVRFGPYPDADTYIAEEASNTNYSGTDELHVSNTAGRRERALITIRLPGLIESSGLERAVLHIYMGSSIGPGEPVTVHHVTAPWEPSTATWESVSGGRFNADQVASIDTESVGWKELDITPLVRVWLEGSFQNYGIILAAPAVAVDSIATFHSSNYPDPLLRPWLEVSFSAASDS